MYYNSRNAASISASRPAGITGDRKAKHLEEFVLVELAHGGAVGAFYIVGINLQLGLGLHPGLQSDRIDTKH